MASEIPPKVDDEIDVFADNAFEALMADEAKANLTSASTSIASTDESYEDVELDEVMLVSDIPSAPPSGAHTVTQDAEVARLQGEISELKAKLAENSGGGGVSSREFLDLREALNSKDKELLDLRDQITAKDKELLGMRDQNLTLERAKADHDEKLATVGQSLQKAQSAIVSLTADKENASKRYEDVKARFERADERVRQLEEEVTQQKDQHAGEVAALSASKAEELRRLTEKHDEDLVTAKAEAAANMEQLREEQAAATLAASAAKDAALAALRTELNDMHIAALTSATSEAEVQKEAALAVLRQELESTAASQLSATVAQHEKTLASREMELTAERDLAVESLEKDHSKQLATLGRKLSDTETELAGVRERERLGTERVQELEAQVAGLESRLSVLNTELEDTRRLHHDVQAALSGTRESRDRLQHELDNTLGDLETMTNLKKDLDSRVGSLEAVQAQLESRLGNAMQKMATDDALLERVRKALGIGIGLLEEQRSTSIMADLAEPLDLDDNVLEVVEDAE